MLTRELLLELTKSFTGPQLTRIHSRIPLQKSEARALHPSPALPTSPLYLHPPHTSTTMAVSSISKTALRRAMAGNTAFNGARTYASKTAVSPAAASAYPTVPDEIQWLRLKGCATIMNPS